MMLRNPLNYYGFWRCPWHPGDAALNCSILTLRMIILLLRMSILYILYKEGACHLAFSGLGAVTGTTRRVFTF
jgi:hypothetical protein